MTSLQDVDENVKITDFQDAGQLQQEELDSIMKTLEGMESKFKSIFQKIGDAFRDLNSNISEGNGGFDELVDEILTNLDDLERRRVPLEASVSTHQSSPATPPLQTPKSFQS